MKKLSIVVSILISIAVIAMSFWGKNNELSKDIFIINEDNFCDINKIIDFGYRTILFSPGEYNIIEPIVLKSDVTLNASEGVKIRNMQNSNVFVAQGSVLNITLVLENIKGGSLAGVGPFAVKVKSTKNFDVGDDVELFDNLNKEFNEVHSVDNENNIIYLVNRPHNYYFTHENVGIRRIELIKNITVENFNIENIGRIIFHLDYVKDANFENNIIKGNEKSGHSIYMGNTDSIRILNNKIYAGQHGISISDKAHRNFIQSNFLDRTWTGVLLGGSKNQLTNNTILNTGTYQGNGDGMTISGNAENNLIQGNYIESGSCYGIWLEKHVEDGIVMTPSKNMFIGNTISSNITSGIYVKAGANNTFWGNKIHGNSHGIIIDGSDNIVLSRNNIFSNSGSGILIYKDAKNIIITDNVVIDNGIEQDPLFGKDILAATGNNIKNIKIENNIVSIPVSVLEFEETCTVGNNYLQ